MNRHLVYALENYHEDRTSRAKAQGEDIATLPDRYVLVSANANGVERYYYSTNVWTYYPGNAKKLHMEGDLFDVMRELEGIKYDIIRLDSKGIIKDVTDVMHERLVTQYMNEKPLREGPLPLEGPTDFYDYLKERHRTRKIQSGGRDSFVDEYYIVSKNPLGGELFNFGFKDGEPYWTTNYAYGKLGAHPFLELNALYAAMRDLHAQGEKFEILAMDNKGKVKDVTAKLMADCAIHILDSIKEEEDMPEETGSKRTTVGSDSAVGVPREERGYAPGSSKAMIERGQMKLYEVGYSFRSGGRFGNGFGFEDKMTFLHRGEETPSVETMRFELQLRGEYTKQIVDNIEFKTPRELSFHQVKMSDLSLHQYIEIQAALMKGEL